MATHAGVPRDPVLWVYLLYPFTDSLLRAFPLPGVAGLWDEAALVYLLARYARRSFSPSPLLRPMGLFAAAGLAAFLANLQAPAVGAEGLRAYLQYMLAFFVGRGLAGSGAAGAALTLWSAGAVAAAAHGLWQYVTGAPMPAYWISLVETHRTRAYSVVGSPNGLGDFLAFALPVTVGLAASAGQPRRALLAAAAGVEAAGLLATLSRGAWLALAGASAAALVLQPAWRSVNRRRAFLSVTALLLAGVAVLATPPVRERLAVLVSPHYLERSLQPGGRLYRWNAAYEVLAHAPLTGAGPGQHGGAVAARRLGGIYTDNYYAKAGAELGLPGLAALLWLLLACVRRGRAAAVGRAAPFPLAAGLWVGTTAVILHNAVENIFEIPFLNAHFWLAMGILDTWAGTARTDHDGGA